MLRTETGFSQRSDAEYSYDISVWHSPVNICELQDDGGCDTVGGHYYGPTDDHITRYCPRHFYAMHLGTDAPYRFVDGSAGHQEK